MNGLAVTIIVGQLPKLFGFSTNADSFFDELRAFVDNLDETEVTALIIGVGVLVILLVLPRLLPRVPAVLVAVVAATAASAAFGLAQEGVATVGSLPSGLPRPSLPWTSLHDVGPLLLAAVGITMVSLTDTIATSSSFAARRGDEVEPNQEMIGIGAANIAAGFFQGFAVSTSGSRTAVAEQAGAKSQVTGLVGAGLVVVLLLFLNSLLSDLPQSAWRLWSSLRPCRSSMCEHCADTARARWSSVLLSLVATLGVITLGVLDGIVVAILLAVLMFFRRNWWPHGEVVGRVDGMDGWHSLTVFPDAQEPPGVLVYRWEAPLFFANARTFREQIRHLVRERNPLWVVIQCEAITDIDVTAAETLAQLDVELNASGVHIALAEMRTRLQDLTQRYGLFETIHHDRFFPSVEAALEAIGKEAT